MNERRRICIITPGALGSNPRVVKEAQALQEAGYDTTVLSTRTLDLVDERDRDVLASAQWRSLRLDLRSSYKRRILRGAQCGYAAAFALTRIGTFADRGLSAFAMPLMSAAKQISADLYIAHYPAALPAAAMTAFRHNALFAFDAEDFHLGEFMAKDRKVVPRQMLRTVEARYLPGSGYVTAASPGIADAYAQEYGIGQPTVVLNVFPNSQAPPQPTLHGSAAPRPSVYWFSQTIGPDRGLECAIRAIGQARSAPHLYLRGTPASGYLDRLREVATSAGVWQRIHILAPAVPSEMERLAACYDVGLIGETGDTLNRRIALTNKLFSYLLAGLPAILSDIPAHERIVFELGSAARLFQIDDSRSLARVLDNLFSNPEQLSAARKEAFRLGQTRFNWDMERDRFLNKIGEVFAGASPAIQVGTRQNASVNALHA